MAAVTATPAWPTPREGCYLLDLVESDFTGYTAPQLTATETVLEADLGEDVTVGLIRIQTDAETAISSVIVQGGGGNNKYVHLGEMEIGAGGWHALRFDDREVRAVRLVIESVSTPVNLHTIELYAVRADLSSNVTGFSAEEVAVGTNSYRRYDGVLVTSDGVRTVPRVELSLARLSDTQVDALIDLMQATAFHLLAGHSDLYRVAFAADALRLTNTIRGLPAGRSVTLSLQGAITLHTIDIQIEIEGQDFSHLFIPEDGLQVSTTLNYPQSNEITTDNVSFSLDNENFDFDYSQPDNFFVRQSLSPHGRGSKVLLRIGGHVVFAGVVWTVTTGMENTKARLLLVSMSAYISQTEAEGLGATLDREITAYPGATDGYTEDDPIFYFPIDLLPILQGSVSATVEENGVAQTVDIRDVLPDSGTLTGTIAEVDYTRGIMRFGAPPPEGENAVIQASWKTVFRYIRPDTAAKKIVPTQALNFGVELARITLTNPVFSSHGKPNWSDESITRWALPDHANKKIYMAQGSNLIEYDEELDAYTEITSVPAETTIIESPPGGYGAEIEDEEITLGDNTTDLNGLGVDADNFYTCRTGPRTSVSIGSGFWRISRSLFLRTYSRSTGNYVRERIIRTVNYTVEFSDRNTADISLYVPDIAIYDGNYYVVSWANVTQTAASFGVRLIVGDLVNGSRDERDLGFPQGVAVTPNRVILSVGSDLVFYDYDFNRVTSEDATLAFAPSSIEATSDYIYASRPTGYFAFQYNGNAVPSLDLSLLESNSHRSFSILGLRLFSREDDVVSVQTLGNTDISYQNLIPFQFDTTDFDSFYFLITNTLRGDGSRDATFNRNFVQKYVKSTDTWSVVLDSTKGQPQLAHAYDFIDHIAHHADNRKGFYVIRRNNKKLIFYRRIDVDNLQASTAYINETDDTLTNIHTETFTSSNDAGVPYSMDFVLDERSDGIYVYSFVVRYTSSSATLKVFRERVEPSGSETEIFSETFSRSGTVEYPISVSSVILADDRSKFYFTLDYFHEDTDDMGKAELCAIPKAGGTRTMIKEYADPLLGARSPVQHGSRYFYLEGGWMRRPKDPDSSQETFTVDQKYYPNAGGRLIEIDNTDTVVDYGIVRRSATQADSPNSDDPIYNGWGLHNAIVSNLFVDSLGQLGFISGYGLPVRVANNLPSTPLTAPVSELENFVWITYGRTLASKFRSFGVQDQPYRSLIASISAQSGFEAGFLPRPAAVSEYLTVHPQADEAQAYASPFFRERSPQSGLTRSAIGTGTLNTIALDETTVDAWESGICIIDKEVFRFTNSATSGDGVSLSGVSRASDGSVAAAHAQGATVFPVGIVLDDGVNSLLSRVTDRRVDFVNVKNVVRVKYGTNEHIERNENSILEFGENMVEIAGAQVLLVQNDDTWAEWLAQDNLNLLSEIKQQVTVLMVLQPHLRVGDVAVLNIGYRLKIEYASFIIIRATHDAIGFQTRLTLVEV